MSGLRSEGNERTVEGARLVVQLTPGASSNPQSPTGARHPLTPGELHDQRVAWGKLWGARISEATKQWKGEL